MATWPSAEVRRRLAGIDRPALDGVRWTPPERWHVTLRFLGEVEDPAPVVEAVAAAVRPLAPPTAVLGDRVERLGPVAVVPVAGLDDLASAVIDATAHLGQPPDHTFVGHVTMARARGRARLPAGALGGPVGGTEEQRTWTVDHVDLVHSTHGPDHRYEILATVPLGP